jgi:outer membrane protein TolC
VLAVLTASFLLTEGLQAESYRQLLENLKESPLLKSAQMMTKAAEEQARAAEGKNLPSLDLEFQGNWLKDTPTLTFYVGPQALSSPMGTTRNFTGELRLSYPIFTGFAVSSEIDRRHWEAERARLQSLDLRRNLILQMTELYGSIRATRKILRAQEKARAAMLSARKKAEGLYKNGLLPPSDLYNIKAKVYDVEAQITQTRSRIGQLFNRLGYLTGKPVRELKGGIALRSLPGKSALKQEAFRLRSDLQALQALLKVDAAQIRLAESRYYPTLALAAGLKRHGDTLALNGDGYTNADRSYVGVDMRWNLFSGQSDRHTVEAARYKHLASAAKLLDYRQKVATEIDNALLDLQTLRCKLRSAGMQVKAQEEYYRLTRGRFDNQLASADELNRAIADLANARSRVGILEEQIRIQRAKIWLMGGLKSFEKALTGNK